MKRALWAIAAIVVLVAAAWGGVAWRHHATFGTIAGEDRTTLTVDRGDRISLAVPDRGSSVGDSWSARVSPDGVLSPVDNRKVMGNIVDRIFGPQIGGGGGTRYFVYDADHAGTAAVTLSNCFQGCDHPTKSAESRSVTWTITVR